MGEADSGCKFNSFVSRYSRFSPANQSNDVPAPIAILYGGTGLSLPIKVAPIDVVVKRKFVPTLNGALKNHKLLLECQFLGIVKIATYSPIHMRKVVQLLPVVFTVFEVII
jgi:hypothetical protein